MRCTICGDEVNTGGTLCVRCIRAGREAAALKKTTTERPVRSALLDPRPFVSVTGACLLLLGVFMPFIFAPGGDVSLFNMLGATHVLTKFTTSLPISIAPGDGLVLLMQISALCYLLAGVGAAFFTFVRWNPAMWLFGSLASLCSALLAHGYARDREAIAVQLQLVHDAMSALSCPPAHGLDASVYAMTPLGIALLLLALGGITLFTAGALPDHRP